MSQYRVALFGAALAASTVLCGASARAAFTYTETFDDGNAGSRFTTVTSNAARTDIGAIYNYDYGSLGIGVPQAGQTTTTGLVMAANFANASGQPGTVAGVNAYAKNVDLPTSGKTVMTFDMYARFADTSASTNYTTYGFYHTTQTGTFNSIGGAAVIAPATSTATSGYWFTTSNDNGTSSAYRALEAGNALGAAANYLSGSQNGSAAGYQALFPAAGTGTLAGFIENRWVNVRLTRDFATGLIMEEMKNPGDSTWTTIFSYVDPSPTQLAGGTVTLGVTDPFSTTTGPQTFVIYDNLNVVNTPEPATLTAVGALGGLLLRRRRNAR